MAKAVRIRIKSGGETHNSLESLLRNFWIEDIIPLQDGRLSRWLEQKKAIITLQKKTQEDLRDYSLALEFCHQFFIHSGNKDIAEFFKDIEYSAKNLAKFIELLCHIPEYKKSAYGIWTFTFCPLFLDPFMVIARQNREDIFSRLQNFSNKKTKHKFVWKWLGICYKEGIGTAKNLDEAKACFEKVDGDNWVKQQLEEIEKDLSSQKKSSHEFREIEEFDITLLRTNMGGSAPSVLFNAIQKIYNTCGKIDFPEIDKALRDLAEEAFDDEIIRIKGSRTKIVIKNRFLGIAAEVAIHSSLSTISRNKRLRVIFPEFYNPPIPTDARLYAYLAWWWHYEKKDLEYAKYLARKANELSSSITQKVIHLLKAKELNTAPFDDIVAWVPPRPTPLPPPSPCPPTSFSGENSDTSENQIAKEKLVKGFFNADIYNK